MIPTDILKHNLQQRYLLIEPKLTFGDIFEGVTENVAENAINNLKLENTDMP